MFEGVNDLLARASKSYSVHQRSEHKGDGLTHEIVFKRNKMFITPLDREDIHALASALDDVLDEVDAVAELFMMFKIDRPTPTAVKLSEILHDSILEVGTGSHLLRQKPWDITIGVGRIHGPESWSE